MKSASLPYSQSRKNLLPGLFRTFHSYWLLTKDLQTGLLLVTAIAGFSTACCSNLETSSLIGLLGSLYLTIAGSTILNMAFDRDIDAKMARTSKRPLPSNRIRPMDAWLLGGVMIAVGLLWSVIMAPLFSVVVAVGVILDVVVYTVWLKRRTPFSIILGGLAGGMPILAGRTLALGKLDFLGILMAISILLWIPTHIMTFNIKYQEDYKIAGIPTFPEKFGVKTTRWIIASSTLLTIGTIVLIGRLLALPHAIQLISLSIGFILMALVVIGLLRPSRASNFLLYKGASIYLLISMVIIISVGL